MQKCLVIRASHRYAIKIERDPYSYLCDAREHGDCAEAKDSSESAVVKFLCVVREIRRLSGSDGNRSLCLGDRGGRVA